MLKPACHRVTSFLRKVNRTTFLNNLMVTSATNLETNAKTPVEEIPTKIFNDLWHLLSFKIAFCVKEMVASQ